MDSLIWWLLAAGALLAGIGLAATGIGVATHGVQVVSDEAAGPVLRQVQTVVAQTSLQSKELIDSVNRLVELFNWNIGFTIFNALLIGAFIFTVWRLMKVLAEYQRERVELLRSQLDEKKKTPRRKKPKEKKRKN